MKSIATSNPTLKDLSEQFKTLMSSGVVNKIKRLECPNKHLVSVKATRLDMISQELYGDTSFDWILALVNGLKSHEVTVNSTIKYPDQNDIINFLVKYGS